jgi:shikimate dehydrogenase
MRMPIGTTRVAAVIGDPVHHSLSPVLHNAAYQALELDWVYVALPVAALDGNAAVAAMRTLGLAGVSVTMPHKEMVMQSADELSDDVRLLKAANTLIRLPDGRIRAESTDGGGSVNALRAEGFDPQGKRCVVLGAGGSGRAVALALARANAREVIIVNRDQDRAAAAVALVLAAGVAARRGGASDVQDADIIINATSIGMTVGSAVSSETPCDVRFLHAGQVVLDLVYQPLETALLRAATAAGTHTVSGVSMLLHQAALQIILWTGKQPPIDVMAVAVKNELHRRATIEGATAT